MDDLRTEVKQSITEKQELAKNVLEPALPMAQQLKEAIGQTEWERVQNVIKSLDLTSQWMQEITAKIREDFSRNAKILSAIAASVEMPDFSEARKQELLESHKEWGKLGWTLIPHATIDIFDVKPVEAKEADKLALQYFDKTGIDYLFEELREKNIKKADIEEAIFCYKNKQYKACALLVFGIIEAKLIRLQHKNLDGKRRQVGKSAVESYEKELIERNKDIRPSFSWLYFYGAVNGTLGCLETLFTNGNDFVKEPDVINRNFIHHGMNRRKVRRKDCIQLFLALYNFTESIEIYYYKGKFTGIINKTPEL